MVYTGFVAPLGPAYIKDIAWRLAPQKRGAAPRMRKARHHLAGLSFVMAGARGLGGQDQSQGAANPNLWNTSPPMTISLCANDLARTVTM
jgi:hypothetical protein